MGRTQSGLHRLRALFVLALLAGCVMPDRSVYGPKAAMTARIEGFDDIRIYADENQSLPAAHAWLPTRKCGEINMYILINNALMPEFSTIRNNTFVVMARASSTLIKAQTRSALLATYASTQKTGIWFRDKLTTLQPVPEWQ